MSVLEKIFGTASDHFLKGVNPLVLRINELEKSFEKMSDEELFKKTDELKKHLNNGKTLDDILPEAFSAVREASKRTLGQRHFDVQLLGGIVMHKGKIAEMKTGEGKTLVATLPAYLNALEGKGVHIVTVNDYLSRRDAVWMGQIYNFLGLSVGCINHEQSFLYDSKHTEENTDGKQNVNSEDSGKDNLDEVRDTKGGFKIVYEYLRPCSRGEAYQSDILYGTNNEFGFDYLRDNIAYRKEDVSQSGRHNFVIIDEIDSILIDESRTPLIISAPDTESGELYKTFSQVVDRLEEDKDYNIDEKMKSVALTDEGIDKVERILGMQNIYTEGGIKYVHHLEQALKAKAIYHKDKDYVVKDGEIILVDEFTGRLMPGRRLSEGVHQSIEAKEGVQIQKESKTYATITFQNYFRLYNKLSGMTGTAKTSEEEFTKVYDIDVIVIPTNKPLARKDHSDKIFQTEKGKLQAAARLIKEKYEKGQPVLVGTVSIEKNEMLSALLKREGIKHEVLNAKNHEREAEIIAQAGRSGAVTIATNMAGRGVDIVLGGTPPKTEDAQKVKDLGGLFVLGTERHEARRIDNQLRGRSGRQGDPGETQFYVSFDDDLLRIFASDKIKNMLGRFGVPEDEPIDNNMVSRSLENAQSKIEGMHFDTRKHLLQYDDVMSLQRTSIYKRRNRILNSSPAEIIDETADILFSEIRNILNVHLAGERSLWNLEEIYENIKSRFDADNDVYSRLMEIAEKEKDEKAKTEIDKYLIKMVEDKIHERSGIIGMDGYSNVLKVLMLQTIDRLWMDHLEVMEYMRSSVGLRAYGQRDPLVEYKNEGTRLFRELEAGIRTHVSHLALRVGQAPGEQKYEVRPAHPKPEFSIGAHDESHAGSSETSHGPKNKIGRNDPCPCGSGKKYKKCHGQ